MDAVTKKSYNAQAPQWREGFDEGVAHERRDKGRAWSRPVEGQRYNGWTNYETWVVNLWLGNDEDICKHWDEVAEKAVESTGSITMDAVTNRNEAVRLLADAMRETISDNTEGIGWDKTGVASSPYSGMAEDLLRAALEAANWREIAEHKVDDLD